MEWVLKNLELIVAGCGGLGIAAYLTLRKKHIRDNDLTQLYIKHKKHTENVNKSAKGIF